MPSWYRDHAAPTPNRPTRIGAVALIERDGTLLFERRVDDGVLSDPSRIVGYADGNVYRVVAMVFPVDVDDGAPTASEESYEVRFVPPRDLLALDLTPAHRPIVESYLGVPEQVIVE